VYDDTNTLSLTHGRFGQLKRWKVGSLSKPAGKEQEAVIKTKLLTGQLSSPRRTMCPTCIRIICRAFCGTCGSQRSDTGLAVSIQTMNHDHRTLTHMFNIA